MDPAVVAQEQRPTTISKTVNEMFVYLFKKYAITAHMRAPGAEDNRADGATSL